MIDELNVQPVERKPPTTVRKRRLARDLMPGAQREIVSQFEVRGVDSDIDIAEAFEAQRGSVMSVLVYELYRRVRRVESRQATAPRPELVTMRRAS